MDDKEKRNYEKSCFKAQKTLQKRRVNVHWLYTRSRVLYRDITVANESVIKHHVAVRFYVNITLECALDNATRLNA